MRKIYRRAALLALAAALCVCLVASAGAAVYLDVKSTDWYHDAASYTVGKGLLRDVSPGLFAPEQPMDRAMFYTVLSRLAGESPHNDVRTNLRDVPAGSWYTGAVVWAMGAGLAQPLEDDAFGAALPVSRGEICLALSRLDKLLGLDQLTDASGPPFPDLGVLDQEAQNAVLLCRTAGIVGGRPDGRFAPQDGASRAEAAQMLQQFSQLLGDAEPADTALSVTAWDTVTGWTGQPQGDFPLAYAPAATPELVHWLNQRIIHENFPQRLAAQGTTLDGNPKHLTNYGSRGIHDCRDVTTTLPNPNNLVDAGTALAGRQEYYGYSLQVSGVARQDRWHSAAQLSLKEPWQCTWWVWGRAAQYLELVYGMDFKSFCDGQDNFGHGKDYYRNLSQYFFSDQMPAANSVVSWSGGSFGHVAYVEAVDQGGIWVSMADSGHSWRGITYIAKGDNPDNPYPLYWYAHETLNGFNHLDRRPDGTRLRS